MIENEENTKNYKVTCYLDHNKHWVLKLENDAPDGESLNLDLEWIVNAVLRFEKQERADPDVMVLIEKDEERIGGKPSIANSRISVEIILDFIDQGQTIDDILDSYPHLDRKLVEGVVEVGLIARKCLEHVDPQEVSAKLFGKPLHLDFDHGL